MHNSLIHPLFEPDAAAGEDELLPPGSSVRLLLIGAAFVGLTVVILGRLAWVQTQLPERYLAALEATSTEYEIIPARDGRILAGNVVLAADVDQYAVQVHYRWLQEPVDSRWLQQQVRNRLSREERRQPALVAKTEAAILAERQQLRDHLQRYAGIHRSEFEKQRQRVQTRVERISAAVNRRHAAQRGELTDGATAGGVDTAGAAAGPLNEPETDSADGPLLRLATAIRRSLTTAPVRTLDDRIVVREEETWHTLADQVPLSAAAMINEHPELFPGARVLLSTQRTYPEHRLAAHVVGARTAGPPQDEASGGSAAAAETDQSSVGAAGLPAAGRRGRFGVELSWNQELQGRPGVRQIVRNRRQQIVSSSVSTRPESGRDVVLTLDVELQQLCEQLLAEALTDRPRQLLSRGEEQAEEGAAAGEAAAPSAETRGQPQPVPTGGSVVVMEAATGRLLAAASAPGFDLSLFTGGSADDWAAVNQDVRRPFLSRFTSMALPPGSTFKTVTAVAGLQTGLLRPEQLLDCRGYLQNPEEHRCLIYRQFGRGHGDVSLRTAMAMSCNVYFFDAAQRMGIQPLVDWTRRFAFGQPTGVDLPFEKAGTVPGPASAEPETLLSTQTGSGATAVRTVSQRTAARRFEREALGLSIGQSRLTVTPLQMTRLLAALVNGGWLVTPHVVSGEGSAHRATEADERRVPPPVRIPELREETLQAVREGLVAAVEEPYGTGYRTARLTGVRAGGKTGTAETAAGRPDHAWFAGFAPADAPEYVVVVVLEHGGSGSHAAGPVAREVFRHLCGPRAEPAVVP